jgi:hypothetical protein
METAKVEQMSKENFQYPIATKYAMRQKIS